MTAESGCHGGRTRSLSRLVVVGGGGSGRSRMDALAGAGDGSSTMGSVLVPACEPPRMRMLEGRRKGDSAVVRRLLRSELLAEDVVSVGGCGYMEDDDEGRRYELGSVKLWFGCGRRRAGSLPLPASRRKSTQVSPS